MTVDVVRVSSTTCTDGAPVEDTVAPLMSASHASAWTKRVFQQIAGDSGVLPSQ